MADEKKKEGVSVKEIEGYAKKHMIEVFFVILFVLATLFTFVFWGAGLSILLIGLGGVLGTLMPRKLDAVKGKAIAFVMKQEKLTRLILAIVGFILAIFVAPLIFFIAGGHAGKSMVDSVKGAQPK